MKPKIETKTPAPFSKVIKVIGDTLSRQPTQAFSENELLDVAGQNTRAGDVHRALLELKRWRGVSQDSDGKWRYSGRFLKEVS